MQIPKFVDNHMLTMVAGLISAILFGFDVFAKMAVTLGVGEEVLTGTIVTLLIMLGNELDPKWSVDNWLVERD